MIALAGRPDPGILVRLVYRESNRFICCLQYEIRSRCSGIFELVSLAADCAYAGVNSEPSHFGELSVDVVNTMITLAKGQPNSVFDADGSAVVIHAKADDYKSDPAGSAGDRIACSVITE